jgi:hypothetical protein
MEPVVRSGERRAYATAVADLWERLGRALARLERIAESPVERMTDEVAEELPHLQYSLHAGAELALGIDPPVGAEEIHEDLVAALAQARDATAEVAQALDEGDDDGADRLLPEWRGALFRVRLARLRALERFPLRASDDGAVVAPVPPPRRRRRDDARDSSLATAAATSLVLGGALLFTAGAVLAAWPLWAAGLALFAGGFVLFRP